MHCTLLSLCLALLASVVPIDVLIASAPTEDSLRELREKCQASHPGTRRRAVELLVEHGGREAWELVFEALEDDEAEVGDVAQLALGELEDPDLVRRLLRRDGLASRHELRRLRAAEALGRMEQVDGEAVARAVDGRQVELARTLLWSLERLARAGRLEGNRERILHSLDSLGARRRDPLLRADLLTLRGCLLPTSEALVELRGAVTDREPALRRGALGALGSLDASEGRRASLALLGDDVLAVRAAALETLAGLGNREAGAALVARLEVETHPRLQRRVVEILRSWTGLKHRADPRPWRDWLDHISADWSPGGLPESQEPEAASRTVVPLSDLALESASVAFLVDFSGSTWDTVASVEEGGEERTRKELLDRRIGELLTRLDPRMHFNLIPYTEVPHPWKKEREPAGKREVADALRYFERCRESGRGNVFDAIRVALAEPGLETVVILTDGAPTGGIRWDMALMVELLLQDNRHRGVVFDVVLVDPPRRLVKHWERLAGETGGRCLEVELSSP